MIHSSKILDYHVDTHDGVNMISRYYLFNQLISDELSPDRAQLLAEPVKNADHNQINWYSNLTGQVVPYENLSQEDQRFAREVIEERKNELMELANKFQTSSSRNRKLAGELLALILSHPEKYQVYMVGGRPVVAGWGLTPFDGAHLNSANLTASLVELPESTPRLTENLTPISEETEPLEATPLEETTLEETEPLVVTPPLTVVYGQHSLWKLFLGLFLGFILLAIAFILLFPGLRIFFDQLLNPPHLDAATFDRNNVEEEGLRHQLDDLRKLYSTKLASCSLPKALTPPFESTEPPTEKPPKEDPQAEPKPIEEPKPELKPQEEPKPKEDPKPKEEPMDEEEPELEAEPELEPESKPKNSPLEIPAGAAEKNDFSFMEGCWESLSEGLSGRSTGLPIEVKYCFNSKGNAVVTLEETDAKNKYYQTCSTTAYATFSDGTLVVTQRGGLICPKDNSKYSQSNMVCYPKAKKDKNEVDCVIEQPGSPSIDTTFNRVD
jgi:hypothetical protein